jgi:hypothetical protein
MNPAMNPIARHPTGSPMIQAQCHKEAHVITIVISHLSASPLLGVKKSTEYPLAGLASSASLPWKPRVEADRPR